MVGYPPFQCTNPIPYKKIVSLKKKLMAKVLSLNTHSWMEKDPEDKLLQLANAIATENYDIVCLQEINQLICSAPAETTENYIPATQVPKIATGNFALELVSLLKARGITYHWSWAYNHIGYSKFHEGVAILSKQPLIPHAVLVSAMDSELDHHTRRVLLAETTLDDCPITVVCVHLSWWDDGFQEEWATLEQHLAGSKNPLLILGDFNNPTDGPGYRRILDGPLPLSDAHVVAEHCHGTFTIRKDIDGWVGNEAELKVDHVFASPQFHITSSEVVFDGSTFPVVSDHYGLAVQLALSP